MTLSAYECYFGAVMGARRPQLDQRKSRVLAEVIQEHVETAEPVGSQAVVSRMGGGISPATVRHEMAELDRMGYLAQPHTSAGRVPTDLGYRLYVGQLINPFMPERRVRTQLARCCSEQTEVESALQATCRVLARFTHCASLASPPGWRESLLKHFELSVVGQRQLLAVIVTSAGQVQHSLLTMAQMPSASRIQQFSRLVAGRCCGRPISELTEDMLARLASQLPDAGLRRQAAEILRHTLLEARSVSNRLIREGAHWILEQREFSQPPKLKEVMSLLDEGTALFRLLRKSGRRGVTVVIGSEAGHPGLEDCALISACYWVGDQPAGSLGILGPKRIRYDQAIPAVSYAARALGRALTRVYR